MGDRVDLRQPVERVGRELGVARPLEPALGDRAIGLVEHPQLEAAPARVDDEQPHRAQPGQNQSRTPAVSSPCSRVYARWRSRSSTIRCRIAAAVVPSPGTRSITSMTRWKRAMWLSMTMSNGVVVVPSSL